MCSHHRGTDNFALEKVIRHCENTERKVIGQTWVCSAFLRKWYLHWDLRKLNGRGWNGVQSPSKFLRECHSNVFSTLGLWFFLSGLTWGYYSIWLDSLSSVPLASCKIRSTHRGEKKLVWDLDLDFLSFLLKKDPLQGGQFGFSSVTEYDWNLYHITLAPSLLFIPPKAFLTKNKKAGIVDYCHQLTAWFQSWHMS